MRHEQFSASQRRAWWPRPIWFAYLGLVGLLGTLHPSLEALRIFAFGGLIYLVLVVIGWLRVLMRPQNPDDAPPTPALPLPGPAAQAGTAWFVSRLVLSMLLTHMNPRQVFQMVLHIGGQAQASLRSIRAKATPPGIQTVTYTLPVTGEWLVFKGGPTPATSHSWDILNQRYGYDFVVADAQGSRHAPDAGFQVTDYFAYGQPVVAPAAGVVVQVRDGVRDAPAPGTGWIDWLSPDFRGNFVVLRHAPNQYSVLAHLIPGQIAVRIGEQVERGMLIGRCGNSGHSSEPHLHFHVQDHPNFYLGMGLPVQFANVVVDGVLTETAVLRGGMRVRQNG